LKNKKEASYHFYDINAKVNWQISSKDRIYLSVFIANDNAIYKETQGIYYKVQFQNSAATLRWNRVFNPKLFSNTSFIYNTYLQDVITTQDNSYAQTISGINDITGKTEFEYFPRRATIYYSELNLHITNSYLSDKMKQFQQTNKYLI
jgi:hypothetical protein